jgi:phage tail sheath gpL-like
MASQQTNPDLSLGNERPGVYVAINLEAPGGGVDALNRRLLILAYRRAIGQRPPNTPFQVLSQQDADDGTGRGSDGARGYAAAMAQIGAGNIDAFICPLNEPPGGQASTYNIIFSGVATAAGAIDLMICGQPIVSVGVAIGDTAAIVAQNVQAAIAELLDIPITSTVNNATITLGYVHKGDVGEDLPIRVNITRATGIRSSPGHIAFVGVASNPGSIRITIGATTITVILAGNETLAQVVQKVVAGINAGGYPVTAAADATTAGQVNLYFAPDRDVRRFAVAIFSNTGLVADTSSGGTVGLGQPSLIAALANLAALPAFAAWVMPFVGTQAQPDLATFGAVATHVEANADGVNMKGQKVHACVAWPAAVAGTVPIGTAPTLTSSARYTLMWCQDAGQQGWELAARVAAARVNNDYPPRNWDGYQLKAGLTAPLVLPAPASRPDSATINTAMRSYYLCPLRVDEGANTFVIEKGTTTSNSRYEPLHDFATIDQVDFWRPAMVARLQQKFGAVSAKRYGIPHTPNTITPQSVADEMYLLALDWDDQDLYDGAAALKSTFKASFNPSKPTRIDASFGMSPVINVHQVGVLGNLVSPSA